MSTSSRPEDGAAANLGTKNLKENQIAPGIPTDDKIENDPKSTNRAHKTAPMPEYSGKSINEQSLSGGGKAADASHGSGKGGSYKVDAGINTGSPVNKNA